MRKECKCLREPGIQHNKHNTSVDSKKINCHGWNMRASWWK